MFMNIHSMRVGVFNMLRALTLSISVCICNWGQSSCKAMGGLHTLRGTEQDTHGRGRCILVYGRKRKILAEVWENPWRNECTHSEVAAHLQVPLSISYGKASLPAVPGQLVSICLPRGSAWNWNHIMVCAGISTDPEGQYQPFIKTYP